jgi:hypothetical protein
MADASEEGRPSPTSFDPCWEREGTRIHSGGINVCSEDDAWFSWN